MHAASFMHALHTPLACKLAQVGGGVAFLYAMHPFWLRARRPFARALLALPSPTLIVPHLPPLLHLQFLPCTTASCCRSLWPPRR